MPTITTAQAAERLGVSRRRVQAMVLRGTLPAKRIGRDWLIDDKDLARVANRRAGRPWPRKHE